MRPQPDFIHDFVAGNSARTLLLLHGTGGNERDLIPLGRELDPNASLLSPRGKVLENGMPRFFRRLAEGVFDLEDLKQRTDELADFVVAAAEPTGGDETGAASPPQMSIIAVMRSSRKRSTSTTLRVRWPVRSWNEQAL